MITAEHVTKRFGAITAVRDVSFSLEKGEIVGLLGPNGAGKTTTLRMLAGFFPPTEGTVKIGEVDIAAAPLEAKRQVGYLPEEPPLYRQMRVDDYLAFVARIKGVPAKTIAPRLKEVKERCGLQDRGRWIIGHLSKGYRQRVGLAQALIHNPPVLIFDEPTVGLDPRQIIEVRHLIQSLGGEHTVILSSHILPEVAMTCKRVIIIHRGMAHEVKPAAEGLRRVDVDLKAEETLISQALSQVPGIRLVEKNPRDGKRLALGVELASEDSQSRFLAALVSAGAEVFEYRSRELSLEDIFLSIISQDEAA